MASPAPDNPPDAEVGPDDFAAFPCDVIRSPRRILHILRQAVCARHPVTLTEAGPGAGGRSRLLEVCAKRGEFLIRPPGEDAAAGPLVNHRVNLLLRQKELTILLSATLSGLSSHHGRPCYAAAIPTLAVSSQMRLWRRVAASPGASLALRHAFADGDRLDARVTDLSEGGLCVALPHLPLRGILVGEHWAGVRLSGRHLTVSPLSLEVRHVRCLAGGQRIGLAVRAASDGQRQMLRRLVLRAQAGAG